MPTPSAAWNKRTFALVSKGLRSLLGEFMVVVAFAQSRREQRTDMTRTLSVAALLHELDHRSPAGCAIALHIRFTTPTYLFQTYPKR